MSGHVGSEIRKLNVSSKKKKKREIKYSKKVTVGHNFHAHTILLKIKVIHLCFIERLRKNKFVNLIDLETYIFKIPEKILQKIRNIDACTNTLLVAEVNLGRPIRRMG